MSQRSQLGLSVDEVAFYDELAGAIDDWVADPKLAEVARDLVNSIKADLTIDWADHESTEAAIRAKIKHLLRRKHFQPPKSARPARTLYRMGPDVWQSQFPV